MDCREEVVRRIGERLTTKDSITIDDVRNTLYIVLNDFDVSERETSIVPFDDVNERLLKRYAACILIEGKKKSTVDAYLYTLKKLNDTIHKPYTRIESHDIRYYLATMMERGVSARSVCNARNNISAFYKWMTSEKIITEDPTASIKPIKFIDKEPEPFSDIELDAFRSKCNDVKTRAIFEFLLASGVRVSELCNMKVADVNFDNNSVHVRNGKGGKDRTTFINSIAAYHLKIYLIGRKENGAYLFYNKNHGKFSVGGIELRLKTLGEKSCVNNVHPHRFRRTFATTLAKRGMPIQEIQRILGHSNINTTMMYVMLDNSQVENSYRRHIV